MLSRSLSSTKSSAPNVGFEAAAGGISGAGDLAPKAPKFPLFFAFFRHAGAEGKINGNLRPCYRIR